MTTHKNPPKPGEYWHTEFRENKPETVEDVLREMRERPTSQHMSAGPDGSYIRYAARIEAAVKRYGEEWKQQISETTCAEIARLKAVMLEAIPVMEEAIQDLGRNEWAREDQHYGERLQAQVARLRAEAEK